MVDKGGTGRETTDMDRHRPRAKQQRVGGPGRTEHHDWELVLKITEAMGLWV